MTDKMREVFEKWAADRGVRDKLALETYWGMFQTMWQAAQSVPVVGEPTKELAALAYQRAFEEGEAGGDFNLRIARQIALLLQPAHSINAAELERLLRNDALYHELLFSVASKYPNESRHETALRYIREAESGSAAIAAEGEK